MIFGTLLLKELKISTGGDDGIGSRDDGRADGYAVDTGAF